MKPWKPCEHCYLRDKYCENAEREQPCIPVQEYLESSSEIKRLQNLLEVSEKEHYKTLQQLDIATKALKEYTIDNWNFEDEYYNYPLGSGGWCHAEEALQEIELVGTSVKEEK